MRSIKAVIFDMDGTLIDTERVSQAAWRRTGIELGAPLPDWMLHAFVGCSLPNARAMLMEEFGDERLVDAMFARDKELFFELAELELEPKPGALEALTSLRDDGYQVALATSTSRATATKELDRFGFLPFFSAMVFGDEIEHSKPEPDIYLKAMGNLGLDPHACVAVEDSFNGVRAGHAAGAHVFMVPDYNQPTDEIAALCAGVIDTLHELPGAVHAMEGC